jgi:ketosteroid isomerase-like protein
MPAKSPEEICHLFKQYVAAGDIDAILEIYDHEVVFLNQAGEERKGREALRQEIAAFVAKKTIFDFNIKQIIQAGDIALMHTEWKVPALGQMSQYAIEVARRQSDGTTWCWLIGDPFTVGKNHLLKPEEKRP